ncbi:MULTISPECIES: hypothetical protein [Paraburkholderia]|uniref:Uncharacterized protein n=1 Tax=Paraburkholderia dioscoreae TaxID=2604047 RepID=A0A5Q4YSR6_9BURK|nr:MULTISPECIES: hypothetical protein [Paraburkholderia]MDR8397037.1 hypothetical protein [Paraburkholderia sp. USG1]VVD27593.1 conserved protein of unknown function [Paraburkholderia dioscoreae]
MMKRLKNRSSTQERGRNNAERLRIWVKQMTPDQIPLNQFGKVARSRVCEQVGIPPSTIRTNSALKKIFKQLDASVLLYATTATTNLKKIPDSANETERLRLENSDLALKLSDSERRVYVLQYLENFGIVVS